MLLITTIYSQTPAVSTLQDDSTSINRLSLYELAKNPSDRVFRPSLLPSTEVGRNTEFGESKFDKGFYPNISLNNDKEEDSLEQLIQENRADQKKLWRNKLFRIIGIFILVTICILLIVIIFSKKSKS